VDDPALELAAREAVVPRLPSQDELRSAWARSFETPKQERRLVGSLAFAATFAAARLVTHSIRAGRGPFRNITPGGRHIHHMTFGIIGLIAVGYAWLNEIGIGTGGPLASRSTAFVYGAGAALTLDEFALWLNLADDYWTTQGRESIDAVVAFGSLLAISVSGRGAARELGRLGVGVLRDSRDRAPAQPGSRSPAPGFTAP
jgi:hypothetical protein